jgi:hypothetical protein
MRQGTISSLMAVVLASLVLAAGVRAQPATDGSFRVHWGVAGHPAKTVDLSFAPIRRDAVVFYEHLFGHFPASGPQVIEQHPGGWSAYMAGHLAKVGMDVAVQIPDQDWTGLAIIDYESWMPYWIGHPEVVRQSWRNFITTQRPQLVHGLTGEPREQVFRQTYLQASRAFWQATLDECKRLRPRATWGFYHLPQTPYWAWLCDDANCVSDRENLRRANDEELGWLYDAVDAHFPSLYTHYRSESEPRRFSGENTAAENELYFRRNLEESSRVGRGKPIIPFVWYRYHPQSGGINSSPFLNDVNLRQMFTIPRDMGCPGVVLWGWVPDEASRSELTGFLDQRLVPLLRDLLWSRIDLYAVNFGGGLYAINRSTGHGVLVGHTGFDRLNSAAADDHGMMYVSRFRDPGDPLDRNLLLRIDPLTAATTIIADYGDGTDLRALAFAHGVLYGIRNGPVDELVTINPHTGVVTSIGPTGFSEIQGLTADAGGQLYAVCVSVEGGVLVRIDSGTGQGEAVVNSMLAGVDLQSIEWSDGQWAWLANVELRSVDLTTGTTVLIGPMGVGDVRGLAAVRRRVPECYANCNGSTLAPVLNVDDFSCFISEYSAAMQLPVSLRISHYANCNRSTKPPVLTVDDFVCFMTTFVAGCP